MKILGILIAAIAGALVAVPAFAQSGEFISTGAALALGAGLIMAVAPGLGALGQSRAASAALDGIARNPQASDKIFTPLILCMALMESLVIFALVMAFMLQSKIVGM